MRFYPGGISSFWIILSPLLVYAVDDPPLPGTPYYGKIDLAYLNGCYFRFQNPRDGQTPISARVTRLDWQTTPEDVSRTFNDFGNANEQNVQLFLKGIGALGYANYVTPCGIIPQYGLNKDKTIVSVLLPTGVKKVEQVYANYETLDPVNRGVGGIFGIRTKEPLLDSDWAYTTGDLLKKAIAQWRELQNVFTPTTDAVVNLIRSDGTPVLLVMHITEP
ncbi:hypothetical protein TARUN_2464 [Trichoderma arundinaceum]|uniref:Uncharacterized protein n=1 Tax=Trichoderma arundinaceum TaxID=490622 RepID=A0A395NUT9_TRIAR|nr:hypothetical protein TARUN_2464 [Trichoderma arundinaceum]